MAVPERTVPLAPATLGERLATWLVIALVAGLFAGSFIAAARIAVPAMR